MTGFSLLSVVCIFVVYSQDRVFAGEFKCNDKLREQDHTLCAADSPYLISSGVSATDKDEIVNLHNRLRGEVEPPAMDMPKLIWDDKLQVVAQKKANLCKMEHDTHKQRNIPAYGVSIGQNLAAGYYTWERAIMGWYDEKENFEYGIGSYNGKVVGHYTQVVHNRAVRVGCGYAKCSYGYTRYFACNYAVGQGSISRPYTEGKSCAKCLGSCNNRLCDCGGKLCMNRGKINLETCQCECTSLYTGNMCEKLTCPKNDSKYCGSQFLPSYCEKFSNVPGSCPYMCGICQKPGCEWKLCKNGGYFNMETCSCECPKLYKGPTCEEISCPKIDFQSCGVHFYVLDNCKVVSNVPESCPYMCGICKKPGCEWKLCKHGGYFNMETCSCRCPTPYKGPTCEERCERCQNGGTLDMETCSCECPKQYKGPTCGEINCPQSDDSPCGSWPEDYCTNKYASYMKIHCPFKCGHC